MFYYKKLPFNSELTGNHAPIPSRISDLALLTNTRPSSSLSNFEIIDHSHSSTPFELSPSASPTKSPFIKLSDTKDWLDNNTMSTEQVDSFHGDKADENPEDFMCSFFRRMGTASDDVKKKQFRYFLQANTAADKWF